MKQIYLLVILCCLCLSNKTYAQPWAWARGSFVYDTGTGRYDEAQSVATDSHGNIYTVVAFVGDSVKYGAVTLVSGSPTVQNGAIVKHDPAGNVLWAEYLGTCYMTHVTVDKADNVYVSGIINTPTLHIATTVLTAVSYNDYFVAKFNSSGSLAWAQNNGPTYDGVDIKTDDQCNLYLGGDFSGTLHFGTDSLVDSPYGDDIMLVKLDSAGHYNWSRSAGGGYTDRAYCIALDRRKNIFISGYFGSGIFAFAGDTLRPSTPPSSYYDNYILKYDSAGTPQWAREIPIHDIKRSEVCTDKNGNVYTISTFSNPALIIGHDTIHSYGNPDFYIAKYNGAGNEIWAKHGGGAMHDYGRSIALDAFDHLWICGGSVSPVLTYDTTNRPMDITTNGSAFVAELDTNANMMFITSFRNGSYFGGNELATDPFGNIVTCGSYMNGDCVIGVDTLPVSLVPMGTLGKYYVAKIGDALPHPEPTIINGIAEDAVLNIYPNPASGKFTVVYQGAVDNNAGISLYSITGQLTGCYSLAANSTTIAIAKLSPGMYIGKISLNGSVLVRKIIIE